MKLIGLAVVVVVAAAIAYLGPGFVRSHSQGSQGTVLITVDQPRGLIDTKVAVTVTGLLAHRRAMVRARTVDSSGRGWASFAVFEADQTGTIDLRTSRPLDGSYQVADSMGLFWSMAGPIGEPSGPLTVYDPPGIGESVTLSVELDGKTVSSRNLLREARTTDVIERHLALSTTEFIGTYFTRPKTPSRRTAVLLFGGSGGGQTRDLEASLLASHGYPALSIAYFGELGLPQRLADIPLEYFVNALNWLRAQPEVDPQRVLVSGVSRGSEAAQLLGVYAANLVHGVIALVPSNVAICAYPGCDGPPWTLGGKALPYTKQFDEPAPTDDLAAVIPVERIQGPIFLACGGKDVVWVSCVYANAIISRLEASHHAYRRVLLSYPDAGHGIGSLPPYLSGAGRSDREGATVSDQVARVNAWPQLLSFIAQA
jgi:dienelactone hydrolase